ncbi:uncharacterized protein LOC144449286 [Glandiceps talaboti]
MKGADMLQLKVGQVPTKYPEGTCRTQASPANRIKNLTENDSVVYVARGNPGSAYATVSPVPTVDNADISDNAPATVNMVTDPPPLDFNTPSAPKRPRGAFRKRELLRKVFA